MVEVSLTPVEMLVAAYVAGMRRVGAIKEGKGEAYGYRKGDPWDLNIRGAMGELAFAKGMNVYWPMRVGDYGEGPPDFPPDVEIKTLGKHYYDLAIRPNSHDDRAYVLVTGIASPFRIHGWIWGSEKEEFGVKTDFGNGRPGMYRIAQAKLHSLDRLEI